MEDIKTEDMVRSTGRIKVLQAGRKRFIEFGMAKVIATDPPGITVNPIGRKALLVCRPEDLEVVEPASRDLEQTLLSRASGEQIAEANKGVTTEPGVAPVAEPAYQTGGIVPPGPRPEIASTEGNIAVSGEVVAEDVVAKPKPKPAAKQSLKELRQEKQRKRATEGEAKPVAKKPKAKPRRRRDR